MSQFPRSRTVRVALWVKWRLFAQYGLPVQWWSAWLWCWAVGRVDMWHDDNKGPS